MVSQFVSPDDVPLLGELHFAFPPGTHAIGRLDSDSEGLLILTTNSKVTRLLFSSNIPHQRTYLVQVAGIVQASRLEQLRSGVAIKVKGGEYYTTTPCEVRLVSKPEKLFAREAEFLERLPHSWLEISLTEGKFRQIRKMMAAIHHRCKRLIRLSIEDLELGDLQPGEVKELPEKDFFELLHISYPTESAL